MSGLDESGIILSAMLEAEIEAADPAVALLVAEAKSEAIRREEKENNEIWKEKVAARKAVRKSSVGCTLKRTAYTYYAPTCSHYYIYPTDDSTGSAYRW